MAHLAPIEPAFAEAASFVEATLDALLPRPAGPEARLLEAMRYATMGGGKRLRAFMVRQVFKAGRALNLTVRVPLSPMLVSTRRWLMLFRRAGPVGLAAYAVHTALIVEYD